MDIAAYISSGVLELYATGGLTAAERAEVESLARAYPEVQAELDEISLTLEQYSRLHAVSPPPALREKVLRAIRPETAAPTPETVTERPVSEEGRVIPLVPPSQKAASQAFKWLIAASVTLLLVSNALSIYFYRNWKESENRLQLAMASQQQYAQNYERVQQRLNQNQMALALLRDPATRRVELKGVEKSPASRVTVYWHTETRNVYLAVNTLPEPPQDRQYQLWALVDGKPVDAGMLEANEAFVSLQQMKDISQAEAFAITLEPKGGSAAPTLTEMYVMGAI